VPRDQTALIIVGHGTSLNENSRKVIEQQVALIRDGGYGFAEVIDAYMEEKPLVNEWHNLTSSPNVVVVPFFIADGLHSYQDIPVLLGFEAEVGAAASQREVFRHNPHHLHGRSLYYSSAIGTEPHMADVILDQVIEFDRKHQPAATAQPTESKILPWLKSKFVDGRLHIGQIQVEAQGDAFILQHVDDSLESGLEFHQGALALREIVKLDASGEFRALKSAPTLIRGWQVRVTSLEELRLALDIAYPAALGLAMAEEQGQLQGVPLRTNLGRQTGMYRFTNTIGDDQAMGMIAKCCNSETNCLRRIVWGLTETQPLDGPAVTKTMRNDSPGTLPLLCVETCPHPVSAARKIAQENHAAMQATAVPPAK
jgi:sirohydrochlorin cobaltochelatase